MTATDGDLLARLEVLEAENRERLERLEGENAALRARVEQLEARPLEREPVAPDQPLSRRAMFGRLAGAAAAGGVAAIAGSGLTASPAAADHTEGFGHANDTGANATVVSATVPGNTAMAVTNTASGSTGFYGVAEGASGLGAVAGVVGDSSSSYGVAGVSSTQDGVFGETASPHGAGVRGVSGSVPGGALDAGVCGQGLRVPGVRGESISSTGVHATSRDGYGLAAQSQRAQLWLVPAAVAGPPTGAGRNRGEFFFDNVGVLWIATTHSNWVRNITSGENKLATDSLTVRASGTNAAIYGRVDRDTSAGAGVLGHTVGTGSAVYGIVGNAASTAPAVRGRTDGPGAAVRGEAANGRGGQFTGGKANVYLPPSAQPTHPASGAAGDLFVDSAKRLWFCKGGTTWAQLA